MLALETTSLRLTCLICSWAGRVGEASQRWVVRALSHAVDGGPVTFTEPLLAQISSIFKTERATSVHCTSATGFIYSAVLLCRSHFCIASFHLFFVGSESLVMVPSVKANKHISQNKLSLTTAGVCSCRTAEVVRGKRQLLPAGGSVLVTQPVSLAAPVDGNREKEEMMNNMTRVRSIRETPPAQCRGASCTCLSQ